ncbi:hypothetical protein L2E82_35253 [Cichorium intybus]|uniref:Uncharacterized protein n=1 Tax=Cichorium intybus TaxID=13427 RepID=A0ACB9BNH4_CICIN|nr:hypothetical protein L2E82_35253 [Cichorium intybus]
MWDTGKMRSTTQLLEAALGALHVKPVILKRYGRKDRAWRFKATSKHSWELIRKQQLGSNRRTNKPFDPGKFEEQWVNKGMVVSRGSHDPHATRSSGFRNFLAIFLAHFVPTAKVKSGDLIRGLETAARRAAPLLMGRVAMMFRLVHAFLEFPAELASSTEYTSWRDALRSRRVLEATVIERDILRDAGLWGAIEPFLHRTWTHEEASFTCRGWDRIMATDEDMVYTELLLEFLSTIHFAPRASDPRSRLVRFRLGGEHTECNLREFRRRTGIYTPTDLQHRYFTRFFGSCIQGEPDRAPNMEIWTPLSNVRYEAGTSRESQLRDPLHRLMHRIVSTSIMQREGGEKVSGDDMTFLWALLDPSRFLHLPFALAVALSTHSTGASSSSPLARGYFITRLARSYGILTAPVAASLTALPPSHTTARTLERMRFIELQPPGQYIRAPTEPPQAPQPVYAQHGRRRRRPEPAPEPVAPTEPHQVESAAIHRLEARVARMEDQLEWIGEVLLELATQQGRRPRPFPASAHNNEAGPSRPPGSD